MLAAVEWCVKQTLNILAVIERVLQLPNLYQIIPLYRTNYSTYCKTPDCQFVLPSREGGLFVVALNRNWTTNLHIPSPFVWTDDLKFRNPHDLTPTPNPGSISRNGRFFFDKAQNISGKEKGERGGGGGGSNCYSQHSLNQKFKQTGNGSKTRTLSTTCPFKLWKGCFQLKQQKQLNCSHPTELTISWKEKCIVT